MEEAQRNRASSDAKSPASWRSRASGERASPSGEVAHRSLPDQPSPKTRRKQHRGRDQRGGQRQYLPVGQTTFVLRAEELCGKAIEAVQRDQRRKQQGAARRTS